VPVEDALFEKVMLKRALACKCPKCGEGDLFKPGFFEMGLNANCSSCGFALARNDSADGPAVFLIFILGFLLVPLALWLDSVMTIPLWVHGLLWTALALGLTLGTLKPIKAYVIALQLKHRASDWDQ
jgi:uncharacterized protein (DUF983 family)